MADSTSQPFHSSPIENNQPPPPAPQQQAPAYLAPSASLSSEESSQKKRGRPSGSKNKSKPPVIITQQLEPTTKTVRITVPYGYDIVEMIEKFARQHRIGLNVENGSGRICNFSLLNTTFTSSGVFDLVNMAGTFMDCAIIDTSSGSSAEGAFLSYLHGGPWLRVVASGADQKVFGGIVASQVMAASDVEVHATTFKSCEFRVLNPAEYATVEQQPVLCDGSSGSSTYPSGGGLGGVGGYAGGLLGGGESGGVLGGGSGGVLGGGVGLSVPTQQLDWGYLMGNMGPPS